jgi:hypothetical protein
LLVLTHLPVRTGNYVAWVRTVESGRAMVEQLRR